MDLVMKLFLVLIGPMILIAQLQGQPQGQPPHTEKKPVTDTYHGIKVTDDYRWLENFDDPAVKAWAAAENKYSRQFLDALPDRKPILDELFRYDDAQPARYVQIEIKGAIFALKRDPKKQHDVLVELKSLNTTASDRVIVDPDAMDPKHSTAIDFFVPSRDGKFVAVSLSTGGSERGDVHVFETATGKPLSDFVPGVNGGTAGGSVAWNADATGFYYTRYPRGKERASADMDFYQQIYFHRLGEKTEQDRYSAGKDFPRIAEIKLYSSPDGRYIGAEVANGDGGEFWHYLLGPDGEWRQIARLSDKVIGLAFGYHDDVYLLSRLNAPRGAVLRISAKGTLADAKVVVPESEAVIEDVCPVPAGLYVVDLAGGPSQARFFGTDGGLKATLPVPPVSSVSALTASGDDAIFRMESFVEGGAWYVFNAKTKQLKKAGLDGPVPSIAADYEAVREFAVSKDGTKVPVNIIRKKGIQLDGSHPTLLYGYGGYGVSLNPTFLSTQRVLLERGFVYAVANLRGGGEFGESWHEQGNLTKKQNVFDDFAASARLLISRGYTKPEKLSIMGGSNGGLLMGAALTQHPELYRAVVSFVGIYDMLRVELSPNGAFNVTEFGTVKEQDQFRALYAYSPYHHVKPGVEYPAVLFLTGDNDPRVDPMNSRKMTAILQASGTKRPVLLRTTSEAGHGIGTARNERFAQFADAYAFLIQELK
jgi:prolyl oligopeptidase